MKYKNTCPDCNSCNSKNLGEINASVEFNGTTSEDARNTVSYLYRCLSCGLVYKAPCIINFYAINLYDNGEVEQYKKLNRNDHNIVVDYINKGKYDSLLDFGCYTGELLSKIEVENKFGVEINSKAAAIAHEKTGAYIFSSLDEISCKFDIIILCDVIEHIDNPTIILNKLASCLNENGKILITTGNSSHITSRIQGRHWYYALNAEHIAFINPKWIKKFCADSYLKLDELRLFKYLNEKMHRKLFNFMKAFVYLCSPELFQYIRNSFSKNSRPGQPGLGTWCDHIFVVLKKASE